MIFMMRRQVCYCITQTCYERGKNLNCAYFLLLSSYTCIINNFIGGLSHVLSYIYLFCLLIWNLNLDWFSCFVLASIQNKMEEDGHTGRDFKWMFRLLLRKRRMMMKGVIMCIAASFICTSSYLTSSSFFFALGAYVCRVFPVFLLSFALHLEEKSRKTSLINRSKDSKSINKQKKGDCIGQR